MGSLMNASGKWRNLLGSLGRQTVGGTKGSRSVILGEVLRLSKGIMLVVLLALAGIFIYDMSAGPEAPVASLGPETDLPGSAPGREPAARPP